MHALYSTVAVRDKQGTLVVYDVYLPGGLWLGSGRTFTQCKEIASNYQRTGKRNIITRG